MSLRFRILAYTDTSAVTLEDMQAKFGEECIWVYNILRVGVRWAGRRGQG